MPPERTKPSRSRSPAAQAYWRANLRLIGVLLSIWAIVSIVLSILLVEQLNRIPIDKILPGFQLPFGFWFAQQGSIYVFVILIFVYAWRMQKLDKKFGVEE